MDYTNIKNKLLKFIKQSISKADLETAILGLSGGVDSSVVAYLCQEAIGPRNVYGIFLPYRSKSQEVEDAELVAKRLDINFEMFNITSLVDLYFENFSSKVSKVRRGNMMARIRMAILFDMSKVYNGLVVGTSNKSEILLGYYTVYGDGASSIAPIGDMYKTEVKEMAKNLDLPTKIVEKKPTAGLWEGQTDEKELGFTYQQADEILYYLEEEKLNVKEIIDKEIDNDLIKKVTQVIESNKFKRYLPFIPKIR